MEPRDAAAARSASQALERTRHELLRHMRQARQAPARRTPASPAPDPNPHTSPPNPPLPDAGGLGSPGPGTHAQPNQSPWQGLREAAGVWWQSHPAHLALELAEPLFEKYARAHPMRVLAVSAAAGAALVLARPWRLISVTGLLVAALKSSPMPALGSLLLRPVAPANEPPDLPEAPADSPGMEPWPHTQAHAQAQTRAGKRTPSP